MEKCDVTSAAEAFMVGLLLVDRSKATDPAVEMVRQRQNRTTVEIEDEDNDQLYCPCW